jgi:hypothetical protein
MRSRLRTISSSSRYESWDGDGVQAKGAKSRGAELRASQNTPGSKKDARDGWMTGWADGQSLMVRLPASFEKSGQQAPLFCGSAASLTSPAPLPFRKDLCSRIGP